MANLYNGFNALALGHAINNTHNGIANRNITGLQVLGDSLSDFFKAREDAQKEADRKKSALDFLMGNGYDQQKAEQFVNTVDPSEAVKYLQGRLDAKEDRVDERVYNEGLRDEQRIYEDLKRDEQWKHDDEQQEKLWKHELEDWTKKNGITYGQAVKQMQFGQLMQQLGLITSKDWGNSRKGVDQYNDTIKTLQDFAAKNPEFTAILGAINPSFDNGGNEGYYDEDLQSDFRKYGSKDYTDDDRESFLKRLIDNNKFSYVMDNPMFKDAIFTFGANVDKKNLMKQVNLQRLLGNTVTETQRGKQINKANFAERINSLYDAIIKAARGKGEFPKLNDNELKALKEKFGKNQKYLTRYTRG